MHFMKTYHYQRLLQYVKIDGHSSVQPGNSDQYFYLKRTDGVVQIFKSALKNTWPRQLTYFEEGVDGYKASPDGKIIAAIVNFKGSEHNPIALIDATTGSWTMAVQYDGAQVGSILWRPDSSAFLFRSNHENGKDFQIYEYRLFESDIRLLVPSTGWAFPIAFSPSQEKLLYGQALSNADMNLFLWEKSSNTSEILTPHEGQISYEAGFGRTDNELYVLSNEGSDFHKLYHWDLDSGKKQPLGPSIDWELSGLEISSCGRYVLYSANEEGYSSLYLIDAWLNNELPTPETKGIISAYSFTQSMDILFCYDFPKRSSEVYLWSWAHAESKQLTWSSYQGLMPHEFVQPELIEYESFDGLKIPAFLYLPKNYKRGKTIPMILHFHGGPEAQFRPNFFKHFQYFLEMGIGICAPNIRGSSGYGLHYMSLDDYKKRMDSVKDGVELARYLMEEGYTSSDKLGVMGGSYGGYMVLSLITEAPQYFAAACDVVGISNLVTFLKNTAPYRRALREAEYGPLSDEEFLKSISPIYKMDRVITPLLVVHGATDPRVPLDEAQQVVDALKARNREVDWLYFDDEGHGIRKLENQILYYDKMFQFFAKYLLP